MAGGSMDDIQSLYKRIFSHEYAMELFGFCFGQDKIEQWTSPTMFWASTHLQKAQITYYSTIMILMLVFFY